MEVLSGACSPPGSLKGLQQVPVDYSSSFGQLDRGERGTDTQLVSAGRVGFPLEKIRALKTFRRILYPTFPGV